VIWRRDLFFFICVVIFVGACNATPGPKSRFLSSFSARDAIKKSYGPDKNNEEFSLSTTQTSSVVGSRPTHHHDDTADVIVSQGDESAFLQRVKAEIEQQLHASGCKITDAGSGDGHYSLGYTDGKIYGWLELWGLRGMGDKYRIIITIAE
jgi:hypothetical protein